ncbi:hypothetical protein ACFQ4O_08795 [Methylopila musalis]|uniref:Uncharacterized protein n=1 Tax=Methylopila musalis TaxID=1134781 RepID=A0ABW3Z788_9HYPH
MTTISVGEIMEIAAGEAAAYAAEGGPDLDERVTALAERLEGLIDSPTVNAARYLTALIERLDAATIALAAPDEAKRGQPSEAELHSQRLFFAALGDHFRRRLEAA